MAANAELILRPSGVKYFLLGAGCTIAGVVVTRLARDDAPLEWDEWLIVASLLAFFGLGAVVGFAQLLPSASYLRLTPSGFEVRSLYRTVRFQWSDVTGFGVARIGQRPVVVFNFAENYTGQRLGRAVAVAITGVEGALPDNYGRTPEALAGLMNDWKRGVRTRA